MAMARTFLSFFQKKPRPTRSLASRLSGYKMAKKSRSETPDLSESPPVISSEPVKNDVTSPAMSDAEIVQ